MTRAAPFRFSEDERCFFLLDQRLLPFEEVWVPLRTAVGTAQAIHDMVVRGAPAIGVTAACAVHVPLTMIFAPGFAFTMMSGWVCFFRQSELRALARTLRRRAPTILLGGAIPAVGGRLLLFPGRWQSDPDWCIKEALLWLVLPLGGMRGP